VLFLVGQALWLTQNKYLFAPFSINRVDCLHCQKVGVVRDAQDNSIMKMCPQCFGVGYHMMRVFDEEDIVCAACGGMGRTDISGAWRNCERCEGRGMIRLDDWTKVVDVEPGAVNNVPESTVNSQHSTSNIQPAAAPAE
jgi:DnaJ-class molecular chaperone